MHAPRATQSDFAVLLKQFSQGDQKGSEQLLLLLYAELHALAERLMANQPLGQTLQATALVSEAYLRLAMPRGRIWEGRAHLMTVAGQAMRCVLIDHARRRACRGAAPADAPSALDQILGPYQDRAIDLLALDEALTRLAGIEPEMARVVELRFFVGLSTAEAAEILGMPKRTLERRWEATRAWLFEELS